MEDKTDNQIRAAILAKNLPPPQIESLADSIEGWARNLGKNDPIREEGFELAWELKLIARGGWSF